MLKEYSWEEKFEWVHQKKLKGNRFFNRKKFDDAIQIYLEALMGLDFTCPEENKKRMQCELQIPCLLNMAICMMEKKDYNRAVLFCDKAILVKNDYFKCYYRRALAYQSLKEYDKALEDFKTAYKYCTEEVFSLSMKESINSITDAQQRNKRNQKAFVEGPLYSDPTTSSSSDPKDEKEKKDGKVLKYNDDLEELEKLGYFKYIAYPIKISYKFIREKAGCCRRKKVDTVENKT